LDVNLIADEGHVEFGEEDDELLRAAEELGIDLSGVRADGAGNGAADEQEEQIVEEGKGGSTDGAGAEEAKVEE
jgi:DNA-directed RNA polymerase subunit beta